MKTITGISEGVSDMNNQSPNTGNLQSPTSGNLAVILNLIADIIIKVKFILNTYIHIITFFSILKIDFLLK